MDIHKVIGYIQLSQEGLVPEIICPMDQGLLYANIDNDDNPFLYCISCEYKKIIGMSLYNSMISEVDNARK